MKRNSLTILGLVLSSSTLLVTLLFDLDLFEQVLQILHSVEHFEADELVIPLLIFIPFFLAETLQRRRQERIEHEKNEIYRAMLRSTHHVLNNFLNQMQWFRIKAEETPDFDRDVLALYDRTIEETSEQVEAMGSITRIDSSTIEEVVAPKRREASPLQ